MKMDDIYRIKIIITNSEGKEETIFFPGLYEKGDNINVNMIVGKSTIIVSVKGEAK